MPFGYCALHGLATGDVASITQADGTADATTLTFGYDDARRLVRITDALGNYIEYTLDSEGNKEAEQTYDPSGMLSKAVTQTFDLYNRLATSTQANEQRGYHYAPGGELRSLIDGNAVVTDYDYDALRRLVQTTQDVGGPDPQTAGAITRYGYDGQDNLAAVVDPNGNATRYAYDDLGNLRVQTSPDTGTTTFAYDAAGNPSTKIDAKGQLFGYSYDAQNRLTSIDAAGTSDDIGYTYDACPGGAGRLCGVIENGITVSYGYDAFGNITSHQGVSYGYDSAQRINTITYPSGTMVSYEYDAAGRVSRIELTRGGNTQMLASNIGYAPFGPVTALTYGNGRRLGQVFDSAHRSIDITVAGVISLSALRYDGNGNLLQRLNQATSESFGYDPLGRLATAQGAFGSRYYAYDKNGNRTELIENGNVTSYAYEAASNRLGRIGAISQQLDENGNTIASGAHVYRYNAHNRLREFLENGSTLASYTYNGLGQRAAKMLPGSGRPVAIDFWSDGVVDEFDRILLKAYLSGYIGASYHDTDCDGDNDTDFSDVGCAMAVRNGTATGHADIDQNGRVDDTDIYMIYFYLMGAYRYPTNPPLLADCTGDRQIDAVDLGCVNGETSGAVSTRFVYGLQGQLLGEYAGGQSTEYVYLNGQPLALFSAEAIYYIHNDHLGTPQALTDAAGIKVWSAGYDPFGYAAVNEDVDGDGKTVVLNLRFPGQYYDRESGLNYNYFRFYNARLGRYLTSDPAELAGGLNLYAYVGGNPLVHSDPLGLFQYHGNYCGPNWTAGLARTWEQLTDEQRDNLKEPIDALDAQCKNHDRCYSVCRKQYRCDKTGRSGCMTLCDRELATRSRLLGHGGGVLHFWMEYNPVPDSGDNPADCCEKQ